MKKVVVIDASVYVNFCLSANHQLVAACQQIITEIQTGKIIAISSELLKIEVANALKYSEPNPLRVNEFMAALFDLPINYLDIELAILQRAIDRASQVGDTVYDASYHVLAQANDAVFITCDAKYYQRAKAFGDIKLLSDV